MSLSRLEGVTANLLRDGGENVAVTRGKLSLLSNNGKTAAQGLKPRSVLGDLSRNTRNTSTNAGSKSDGTENEFKKPVNFPAKVIKKQAQEIEKVKQQSIEEIKPTILDTLTEKTSSFSSQNLNNVIDIDTEFDNPQLVAVYVKDIYKYLHELEIKTPIKANYMEGYKIRPTMRSILIDWMIEVHGRFKLLQETLFLTVAIMDRFLQMEPKIVRQELQLVGLTAMFIASKFEEMFAPEIHDFVFMSDKAYTKDDILEMEYRILKALDFNLGRPLPLHFLRRYTKVATAVSDDVDVLHHTLSKYLMELTLTEYDFCHFPPSQLAAACLCLSLKLLDENESLINVLWNDTLVHYSGYSFENLEPVVEKLCALIIKSDTYKFQAVRKKYAVAKFYNISTIHHLKSPFINLFAKMALKS